MARIRSLLRRAIRVSPPMSSVRARDAWAGRGLGAEPDQPRATLGAGRSSVRMSSACWPNSSGIAGALLSRDLLLNRVGVRLCRGQPYGGRACPLAARENRSGSSGPQTHRHCARDRLSLRGLRQRSSFSGSLLCRSGAEATPHPQPWAHKMPATNDPAYTPTPPARRAQARGAESAPPPGRTGRPSTVPGRAQSAG